MPLEIRTAIERRERRDARQGAVLHEVWQQFLDRGGPLAINDIERAFRDRAASEVRASLTALDEADLLLIEDDVIRLAYPFGIAPMLDQAVTIRSRCHHCDEPLVIDTEPDGPRSLPEAMVWIAPRDACAARVASGL